MKNKKELKEMEKKKLEKAAQESEENRLKVEQIERLEEVAHRNKKNTIRNAILSGMWGLTTLLNLTNALTNDRNMFLVVFLNVLCCALYGASARREYKEKKENEEKINKIKREVLVYSK